MATNLNRNLIIGILAVIVLAIGIFYLADKKPDNYTIKMSGKSVVISDEKWEKSDDPETYAKNFEAREMLGREAFPQVITVYLNTMTADRMSGKKTSENEWLEMFVVHPQTVTVQIRRNKGDYWVLSRQTFSVSEPQLINANPESSEQNFALYQSSFQNEIDTTRHILDSEF